MLAVASVAALGQGPFSVDEMLRPYDRAIDGRYDPDEAIRYHVVQGERICGWSCDPTGPYYAEDKHLCPAQCRGNYYDPSLRVNKRKKFERIDDVCQTPPPPLPATVGKATCSSDAAQMTAAGVWMLIGVQTGPANKPRRDGVRASWKRWEKDLPGVLICFLVGRQPGDTGDGVGLAREKLAELDAEAREHQDFLWLPNATDAGVPTIKGYHWWTTAGRLLPPEGSSRGIQIAAKVDDDSFLHVGNLVTDMRKLHCAKHLHYGSMAYTGYDPSIWKMCGWSWQPHGRNFRKERCARRGAYAPFPFMNGVLELLSAPLVRHVASSPEVRGFVARAERAVAARKAAGWGMSLKRGQRGPRVWRQNEDVALGFWLSRAERKGKFNVTWVRINDRAMNMGCISTKGMYQVSLECRRHVISASCVVHVTVALRHTLPAFPPVFLRHTDPPLCPCIAQRPRNDSISIHFLKRPGGLEYLWEHLHDGRPHSAQRCVRWVWHDNCRTERDKETAFCKAHPTDTEDPNFNSRPVRAEDQKAARERARAAATKTT